MSRRSAVTAGLIVAAALAVETWLLVGRRSGEPAYQPPAAVVVPSLEAAGDDAITQTFVPGADGLAAVSRPASAPAGCAPIELRLSGGGDAAGTERLPPTSSPTACRTGGPAADRTGGGRASSPAIAVPGPSGRACRAAIPPSALGRTAVGPRAVGRSRVRDARQPGPRAGHPGARRRGRVAAADRRPRPRAAADEPRRRDRDRPRGRRRSPQRFGGGSPRRSAAQR